MHRRRLTVFEINAEIMRKRDAERVNISARIKLMLDTIRRRSFPTVISI